MDEKNPAELSAAQSEAVRRLLADARADQPIPDDVAGRLDDVLAGLVGERAAGDVAAEAGDQPGVEVGAPADQPGSATVIPLRRRRWPKVLLAAAAVTVFGYGGVQLVDRDTGSAPNDDAGTASSREAATDLGEGEHSGPLRGGSEAPELAPAAPAPTDVADSLDGFAYGERSDLARDPDRVAATVDLSRLVDLGRLASEDGVALRRSLASNLAQESGQLQTLQSQAGAAARGVSCGPYYEVEGSQAYAARWKGRLALVLVFPPVEGLRRVEIYDCGSAEPRRTVQVVTLAGGE